MKKIPVLVLLIFTLTIQAQDRLFTYTYQSNVLNKTQKELEISTTYLNGRDHYYRELQHRIEFEIGLGGKLQTAFYLNYAYAKEITETDGSEQVFNTTDYSFSNEWKYKITDPLANLLGTAIYFEYTLGPSETELEGKLIFDKQTGKVLQALNLVGELEFENEFEQTNNEIEIENETEKIVDLEYGFTYHLKNSLSIGFEARNQNIFSDSGLESSVLSLGPCISYYFSGFWVNLTVLPQLTNIKGSGLDLEHSQKLQARLIFSYVL